jgi:hypothetical protein
MIEEISHGKTTHESHHRQPRISDERKGRSMAMLDDQRVHICECTFDGLDD